ncbi:SH3 domain-containing protein [Chryseosolibacter indicus]|uniref:SH3 domain-containing protein n=1 Tax=Chryseosolibacter indicus TaxID=2782351 RepID=A0ABS5VW66_9BACT|nr:SH3 domain-containing protein [Chryseosolibacter indicus]MBT1705293.1 SH3 domain-containing protein [Chryseosolibacter indicus]
MKKMQSRSIKNITFYITLILTTFQYTYAQTSSFQLKTADSLFLAKRYTQSFEHYKEILDQKQYTPAMVLKMAFIQEGLDNVGQAMYYLNLYYSLTNDKAVLDKMTELADKHNLEGYETSDTDHFLDFYYDNYLYITAGIAAIVIFFLSLTFYTKLKLHKRPIFAGAFVMLLLIGFFLHVNFGDRATTAIITNTRTYIMNGPSPGAPLVTITGDGHRVKILGKTDVWTKIQWGGQTAYVRDNSLLPIRL